MKTKSLLRGLLVGAALLGQGALALASPPTSAAHVATTSPPAKPAKPSPEPPAEPPAPPPSKVTAAPSPQAAVPLPTAAAAEPARKTRLSPEEQLAEARSRQGRMVGQSTLVRKRLQRARRDRDLVVAACLTEKLTQLNVAIRAADARVPALRDALARRDAAAAEREYTAIGKLAEHAEDVDAEAKQCASIDLALSDTTAVKVTLDPQLAPVAPSYPTASSP